MVRGFDTKCRRYLLAACIIFSVNVLLVYNLVSIKGDKGNLQEDPSGRGHEDDDDHADHKFIKERLRHIEEEKRLLRIKEQKKQQHVKKKSHSAQKVPSLPLHSSELDFTPECNITSKEAILAVRRATSQACKKEIIDVVCAAKKSILYPTHIQSLCPAPGVTSGKSLGCYQDDSSMRLLTGYFINLEQANSPLNCSNLCLQSGFPYAGVEYWTKCFCGTDRPPISAQLPDSSCNMKCPTDNSLTCGGHLAINIFETGIVKFYPQTAKTEFDKGYHSEIRIAYLLTFSGRALRQVKRLLKAIYHKDHFYLIHVDVRQDYLFRELLYLEKIVPNIQLMRSRQATMWAGTSLLSLILAAMKELLEINWRWDFVINLSESDFPIKTNDQLVEFLTANKNFNFVKSTGKEVQRFIQRQGLHKTFVECDGHMWRVGDRNLPTGLQMDGGSDWMALSRSFVKYVVNAKDDLLVGLHKIYKHTLLPAESFFHVVLRNTEFCDRYIDNNLHLTNWKRHLGCRCQYKHIVDWCGCSPNDFTMDDWSRIEGTLTNSLFFARKFEPVINQGVINKLELWLCKSHQLSKKMETTPGWLSFWQSVYHRADLSPPRDESILSLSSSLARLAARTILNKPISDLIINESSVIELTSYYHDDMFQGVLIKFGLEKNAEMEAWFKIPNQFTLIDLNNGKFIEDLYVTQDFDLKEQISRSLQCVINPLSSMSIVYKALIEEPTNLTFLFEDPHGQLAHVLDVRLDYKEQQSKPYIGSSKVPLSNLLPGIWIVHVYHEGFHIAEVKFLVVPLQTLSGQPNGLTQLSGGIAHYPIPPDKQHWAAALENHANNNNVFQKNQIGHNLHVWTDGLVSRFFTLVATCHLELSGNATLATEACESTVWSTAAPDLKSRIISYSAANGKLS